MTDWYQLLGTSEPAKKLAYAIARGLVVYGGNGWVLTGRKRNGR